MTDKWRYNDDAWSESLTDEAKVSFLNSQLMIIANRIAMLKTGVFPSKIYFTVTNDSAGELAIEVMKVILAFYDTEFNCYFPNGVPKNWKSRNKRKMKKVPQRKFNKRDNGAVLLNSFIVDDADEFVYGAIYLDYTQEQIKMIYDELYDRKGKHDEE